MNINFLYPSKKAEVTVMDLTRTSNDFISFLWKGKQFKFSIYYVNFIHDFTINPFEMKTDMPLKGLTPDYVSEEEIIEYSTCLTSNSKLLEDNFRMKHKKYEKLARDTKRKLFVVIISPFCVYTNQDLPQNKVDEFVENYNTAIYLREQIQLNFNLKIWFPEEETKIGRILNTVLKNSYVVDPKDDFERSLNVDLPPFSSDLNKKFLKVIADEVKGFKQDRSDHTVIYETMGTREDYKRIVPVCLSLPSSYNQSIDYRTELINPFEAVNSLDLMQGQQQLISSALNSIKIVYDSYSESQIALENIEPPLKRTKHMYRFKVDLTLKDRINLAKSGVQAKKFKDDDQVSIKRQRDKESFSLNAPVDDIEEFIYKDKLKQTLTCHNDFCLSAYSDWVSSVKTRRFITEMNSAYNENVVKEDYKFHSNNDLMFYCKFLQCLFTEINLSVRDNMNNDHFEVKPIPGYNCDVYIKSTGSSSPIFFFTVFQNALDIGQKTLGVKYEKQGDYIITEWSSVKLRDIENYLSIHTKMVSISSFLTQLKLEDEVRSQHLNLILLLLLSNKDRNEELITLLRYIYMRSLSATDNVTTLVNKLPVCLRSRLDSFLVKSLLNIMHFFYVNKPYVKELDGDRDICGLIDIFNNKLNFKQSLNFCYYGYIVNKTKQTERNQSSKLIDKILEYDLKVEDGSKLAGVPIESISDHYHNNEILSVLCYMAEVRIKMNYGMNYKTRFHENFIQKLGFQNLETLSSIKASAKMDLPDEINESSLKKMKKRRPRVVQSLNQLCDSYGTIEHPLELVNHCIEQLDKLDCFNVELFSKDQHAGIREIYVVDIRVRVIQWFIELISRTLCEFYSSETMTNPAMKDHLSQKMTRSAIVDMKKPMMLCRSGDASKWSQTQNVTKFYQVLKYFLPTEYHNIVKSILTLWYRKKIYLPVELLEVCNNFDFNKPIENKTLNFLHDIRCNKIVDRRLEPNKPYMRIKTGFMQGILHFTSSFFHSVIQEGFLVFKDILMRELYPRHAKKRVMQNIILQGSDDNSEIMIIEGEAYKERPNLFKIMVQIKDIMSKYVGIKVSHEKTASCTSYIMEYNSMWELAGKFIMPTIKFIMVACDIPQKQTLLGRQEFYYSLLTSCLEKGATIRTCNVIRLAQCQQHYLQLGLNHNQLFPDYYKMLKDSQSPSMGYFMFEIPLLTSLIGFDFMLYFHCTETNFKNFMEVSEKNIPYQILINLGYKSLENYSVGKLKFDTFQRMMKTLDINPLDISRENINNRPEILYGKLHDSDLEWDVINMKLHDFSVKESLCSKFSKSDMFSSLVYILSRAVCSFHGKKHSLMKLLTDMKQNNTLATSVRKAFPRSLQYIQLLDSVQPYLRSNDFQDKQYVQRGSSTITLVEGLNDESYKLIDLCRHKWFGHKVLAINEDTLNLYFKEAQDTLPWLKPTEKETKEFLECDSFQLYTFLLNSFKDVKKLKLLDTPGKKGDLIYLISRITDVNKKLIPGYKSALESKLVKSDLRSNIKFLIDFPFNFDKKTESLKPLLIEYKELDHKKDERNIIEFILALLNNDTNLCKNLMIKRHNDLNLAIFTQRQEYDENTKSWKGFGVVLCKNQSLIYEILIKDRTAMRIRVNNLCLARKEFRVILKTLNELHLDINQASKDNGMHLNKSGINFDLIGTYVEENTFMTFNLSRITGLNLVFEHKRIKIVSTLTAGDINENTLIDLLPMVKMFKVETAYGEYEWVKYHKIRGRQIYEEKEVQRKELSQRITLTSLKSSHFNFDMKSKPRFEITNFVEYFWKQKTNVNELGEIIINMIKLNKLKNYEEFCHHNKLDLNFKDIIISHLSGKYKMDRVDDTEEILQESEIQLNESYNMTFEDVLNFRQTGIQEIFDMFGDDDGDNNDDFDFCLENFVDSLDSINKSYYLPYMSPDVLNLSVYDLVKIQCLKHINNDQFNSLLNDYNDSFLTLNYHLQMILKYNLEVDNGENKISANQEELKIYENYSKLKLDVKNKIVHKLDDNELFDLYSIIKIFEDDIKVLENEIKIAKYWIIKNNKQKILKEKKNILENLNWLKDNCIKTQTGVIDPCIEEIKEEVHIDEKAEDEAMEDFYDFMNAPKVDPNDSDDVEFSDYSDDGDFEEDIVVNDEEEEENLASDKEECVIIEDKEITSDKEECVITKTNIISHFNYIEDDYIKFKIPGDGSCLFHSLLVMTLIKEVSFFLEYHDKIRKSIVEWFHSVVPIDEREKMFIAFKDEFNDYPQNFLNDYEWGDFNCIIAFSYFNKCNIHVIAVNDKNEYITTHSILKGDNLDSSTFYLINYNETHYEPLIPKTNYETFKRNADEVKSLLNHSSLSFL